ncbi:MAG: LTA synthase family protein [Clostridiales bacterium]|nr:LTA synthase family protein [Clostridiales bacterium]
MNKGGYLRRWLQCLPCVALLLFMYTLFGSVEVYLGNTKDFPMTLGEALLPLGLVFLAGTVIISLLVALSKGLLWRILTGLISGAAFCSYLQNLCMNKNTGLLGDDEVDWSQYGNYGTTNLILWIALLIAVVLLAASLKKNWGKVSALLCSGLLAMQAVALAVVMFSVPSADTNDSAKRYILDGNNQYTVSAKKNTIVFVLDYFANTYYNNVIDEYPEAADYFNDFTYYSNCDPVYIGTFPSMTHMLTGYEYDPSSRIDDWFNAAWNSESSEAFYKGLAEQNTIMRVYTTYGKNLGLEFAGGKIENLIDGGLLDGSRIIDHPRLISKMLSLAAYRYFPHEFKQYFLAQIEDFSPILSYSGLGDTNILNTYEYYDALNSRRLKADEKKSNLLIVQHLRGTHIPYELDSEVCLHPGASMEETGVANLKIVKEYIDQLKELGLYEDATIIITADHGDKENNMQVIYFLKQPGEKHNKMQRNDAPISHDDFPGTVLQLTGGRTTGYNFSTIFDFTEDDERERTVMVNTMDKNYPAVPKYGSFSTGTHTAVIYYTYEGNLKDLRKQIKRGPTKTVPLAESFN